MAGAGRALLQLDLAGGQALRPDDDLPGQPDQVHGGEFGPCPVVAVVIKHAQAGGLKLAVKILAGRVGRGSPILRLISPTSNGATDCGQMMPASSCEASMMAPTSRDTPMP